MQVNLKLYDIFPDQLRLNVSLSTENKINPTGRFRPSSVTYV